MGLCVMGHDTYVEVDHIQWFAHHGPADPIGPCPHDCKHTSGRVIAWGPSFRHYELIQCDDVCGGKCRAWESALPKSNGGIPNSHPWLLVAL